MVEAVSGKPYTTVLRDKVYEPVRLKHTQLKNRSGMPKPFIHSYGIEEDGSLEDVARRSPSAAMPGRRAGSFPRPPT
jgi:CubicO group peptidase (beta-lactamase class C family)